MSGPVAGVFYSADPVVGAWRAPGHPDLPYVPVITPPPPPPVDPNIYAGAAPLGTTNYAIPTGSVFVNSSAGSDVAAGTQPAPFATAQHAINAAADGSTLVLRGGTYHETLTSPSGKTLHMQAYPGEVVWFDGSSTYSVWTNNGNGTWTANYAVNFTRFDASSYPGAAFRNYPDQVWVDGVALTQVEDATTPGSGQFSVNQSTHKLTIGIDPTGRTVKVSDLNLFLTASGRLDLLGIGIRNYAPQAIGFLNSMAFFGGTSAGNVIENCIWQGSAMAALALSTTDNIVQKNTFQDCGYSGVLFTTSDGLTFAQNLLQRLNLNGWSPEPTTAAVKGTRTDSSALNPFVIRDNVVKSVPGAYGIWLDVSCIRFAITNNDVDGGGSMVYGIEVEESDGGNVGGIQYASYVAGNRVRNCSAGGIKVLCTGWTRVWNNDVRRNNIGIYAQQDRNQNSGTNPANRPKAVCPWHTVNNEYVNNILDPTGNPTGSYNIQFQTYDNGPKVDTGIAQILLLASNWFAPNPSGGSMVQLGKIGGARVTYNTLSALAAADSTVGGPWGSKLGTNYQGSAMPDPAVYGTPLTTPVGSGLYLAAGTQIIGPNTATLPISIEQKAA